MTVDDLFDKVAAGMLAEDTSVELDRIFRSGRRVMKEWVRLSPGGEDACAAYVAEARRFAA
jgi:hypothetical protein